MMPPRAGGVPSASVVICAYTQARWETLAAAAEAARGALRDGAHVTIEADRDLFRRHRRMREHPALVRRNLRAAGREREESNGNESDLRAAHD